MTDLDGGALGQELVQLEVTTDCVIGSNDRGLDGWAAVGQAAEKRNMKDVAEIQIDRLRQASIDEAIERLFAAHLQVGQVVDNLIHGSFVNDAFRSPDQEGNFLEKPSASGWSLV